MVVRTKLLLKNQDALYPDPSHYRSIVGALQYLTLTRPDLAFSVNSACQFLQNPTMGQFQAVKRILRYVRDTLHFGIRILSNSSLDLYGFSDVDWVGYSLTCHFTTGYCIFLGANFLECQEATHSSTL